MDQDFSDGVVGALESIRDSLDKIEKNFSFFADLFRKEIEKKEKEDMQ